MTDDRLSEIRERYERMPNYQQLLGQQVRPDLQCLFERLKEVTGDLNVCELRLAAAHALEKELIKDLEIANKALEVACKAMPEGYPRLPDYWIEQAAKELEGK